jgi:hypothetical protein
MKVYLQKSTNKSKKFMVTIVDSSRRKTVHFGAKGYSDFTIHKDPERMRRYDARHSANETWTKRGIRTAGFWSKWLLWSKPSLTAAIKYTSNKFNISIVRSAPPSTSKK